MIVLQTIAVAFAMFSAIPVPQFDWNEKNSESDLHRDLPLQRGTIPAFRTAFADGATLLSSPGALKSA